MTNGEKLKSDFPYIEIKGQDEVFTTIQIDTTGTGTPIIVYTEWWNAEYKEPTTKNNLGVDLISRADAIKAMQDKAKKLLNEDTINGLCGAVAILFDLPSVTPIRPKGHWIDKQRLFDSCSAECSSCHKRSNGYMHDNGFSLVSTYYDICPNCGADMREVEE